MTVTLAEIERELAMRVGPYQEETAASGTTTTVVVDALTSTIDRATLEDLYLLRRGVDSAGDAVGGFVSTDRIRTIKTDTASTGTLEVDRAWTNAPVADEQIELHYLHPERELRAAALAGLKRCWFVDRAQVTLSGAAAERNLTTSVAWITDPEQVYRVEWSYPNDLTPPALVTWWKTFTKLGSVWIVMEPDVYPNNLLVTARRSHFTYVNAADSTTGPTADDDELLVDLDYAAAFGHAEAWRRFRPLLAAAARNGDRPSQAEVAVEATRLAMQWFNPPRRQVLMTKPLYASEVLP